MMTRLLETYNRLLLAVIVATFLLTLVMVYTKLCHTNPIGVAYTSWPGNEPISGSETENTARRNLAPNASTENGNMTQNGTTEINYSTPNGSTKLMALTAESIKRPNWDYNWTVLLTVNEGFRDFFTNWYWHFIRLGINVPIVIETEDDIVYAKLKAEFPVQSKSAVTVERSLVVNINESVVHGSDAYAKLVSARPTHILKYLQKGINVLYTDIDTVWLKDPFPYFTGDYDLWIEQEYGRIYCTGFMAIKPNNKTIHFIKEWQQGLNKTLQRNQPFFNKLLKRKSPSIQFKPLNETIFPMGSTYYTYNSQQRSRVVVMHNTYVYGHSDKLERFKNLKLWFQTP